MEPAMADSGNVDHSAWCAVEIGLPVDQIESVKRFYCEGLGFQPCGSVDLPAAHIEGLRFGNCMVKLTLFRDVARRPSPRDPDPQAPYVTVRVLDIHHVVDRCRALGMDPLMPLKQAETASGKIVSFAFFADPMGNRVELVEGDAWS